jgi:hypothetical protein
MEGWVGEKMIYTFTIILTLTPSPTHTLKIDGLSLSYLTKNKIVEILNGERRRRC